MMRVVKWFALEVLPIILGLLLGSWLFSLAIQVFK